MEKPRHISAFTFRLARIEEGEGLDVLKTVDWRSTLTAFQVQVVEAEKTRGH